jgi:hypothetical protein
MARLWSTIDSLKGGTVQNSRRNANLSPRFKQKRACKCGGCTIFRSLSQIQKQRYKYAEVVAK